MTKVHWAWTSRADGDLAGDLRLVPGGVLADAPRPWTWLHQVHGAQVVTVTEPGEHAGADADAVVTATPGCTLAVRTADCAPIVLEGRAGVGLVHAGWRGLVAGVVDAAVDALRALDGGPLRAHLGPCIRAGCYEFGEPELAEMSRRFGDEVTSTTTWGTPALDLPAAVRSALRAAGALLVSDDAGCTACDPRWYSYRARGETERMATVAWMSGRSELR